MATTKQDLKKAEISEFFTTLDDLKESKDAASVDVMNHYKAFGEKGHNRKAASFVQRLRGMKPTAQNDLMSQITDMIRALGLCQQMELFGDKAKPVEQPPAPADNVVALETGKKVAQAPAAAADDEFPASGQAQKFEVGAVREAGERAGYEGKDRSMNPHPEDSDESRDWDGGFTIGAQRRADEAASAEDGNSNPRRRRGRGAAAAAGAEEPAAATA